MAAHELPAPAVLRQLLDYDPETGIFIWRERPRSMCRTDHEFKRWNSRYAGKQAFTQKNNDGYHTACVMKRRVKAHQVAFAMANGRWPVSPIDHINGDRTDNSARNLREVTPMQNSWNAAGKKTRRSSFKGVGWNRKLGAWTAQINANGKRSHLGVFASETDAAAAYDAAAVTIHGEFARINGV